MGKIIAIGGGQSRLKKPIMYKEIIRLCEKKKPKVLILPTAANDVIKPRIKDNIKEFKKLKGVVKLLYLIQKKYSITTLEDAILNADIVYVCGGSTKLLVDTLKKLKVDKVIKKAYNQNIVLAGSSAGANFLFKYCNSDYLKEKNLNAPYVKINCLGIINAFCCPHYDTEKGRKTSLKEMIKKYDGVSIGLDECAALEIVNDTYRPIIGIKNVNVYKIYWKNNKYYQIKLINDKKFRPLKELLEKK